MAHNNINPETIVLCNDCFKLNHPLILPTNATNIDNYHRNNKTYCAPEVVLAVNSGVNVDDPTRADLFSLGLSILEAASLEPERAYYDSEGRLMDSLVRQKVRKVSHVYSKDFINLLCMMLMADPAERVELHDVIRITNRLKQDYANVQSLRKQPVTLQQLNGSNFSFDNILNNHARQQDRSPAANRKPAAGRVSKQLSIFDSEVEQAPSTLPLVVSKPLSKALIEPVRPLQLPQSRSQSPSPQPLHREPRIDRSNDRLDSHPNVKRNESGKSDHAINERLPAKYKTKDEKPEAAKYDNKPYQNNKRSGQQHGIAQDEDEYYQQDDNYRPHDKYYNSKPKPQRSVSPGFDGAPKAKRSVSPMYEAPRKDKQHVSPPYKNHRQENDQLDDYYDSGRRVKQQPQKHKPKQSGRSPRQEYDSKLNRPRGFSTIDHAYDEDDSDIEIITTRTEYTVVDTPVITADDLEKGRAIEKFRAHGCKIVPNQSQATQTTKQIERDDFPVVGQPMQNSPRPHRYDTKPSSYQHDTKPSPTNTSRPSSPSIKDTSSPFGEMQPVQRYMRVRRYSQNKDGQKELIGEEELVFDDKNLLPNPKVDRLIKELQDDKQPVVSQLKAKPTSIATQTPTTTVIVPSRPDDTTFLTADNTPIRPIDSKDARPVRTSYSTSSTPRQANNGQRGDDSGYPFQPNHVQPTIILPPNIVQPPPPNPLAKPIQPASDFKPANRVVEHEHVVRRDLSPNVDSALFDARQFDHFKDGEVCRLTYVLNDRNEIVEQIVRKTSRSVRKESRPVVDSEGELSGLFKNRPEVLEKVVSNGSGKKVKEYIKRLPYALELNIPGVKRTFETSGIMASQHHIQPPIANGQHASPRLPNAEEYDGEFYPDSLDHDKLSEFLRDEDDDVKAILKEVVDERRSQIRGNKTDNLTTKPAGVGNNGTQIFGFASQESGNFEDANNAEQARPRQYVNPPADANNYQSRQAPQQPLAQSISPDQLAHKPTIKLRYHKIDNRMVPIAIDNEEITEQDKYQILNNYLKSQGFNPKQIEELIKMGQNSPMNHSKIQPFNKYLDPQVRNETKDQIMKSLHGSSMSAFASKPNNASPVHQSPNNVNLNVAPRPRAVASIVPTKVASGFNGDESFDGGKSYFSPLQYAYNQPPQAFEKGQNYYDQPQRRQEHIPNNTKGHHSQQNSNVSFEVKNHSQASSLSGQPANHVQQSPYQATKYTYAEPNDVKQQQYAQPVPAQFNGSRKQEEQGQITPPQQQTEAVQSTQPQRSNVSPQQPSIQETKSKSRSISPSGDKKPTNLSKLSSTKKAQRQMQEQLHSNSTLVLIEEEDDELRRTNAMRRSFMYEDDKSTDRQQQSPPAAHTQADADARAMFGLESMASGPGTPSPQRPAGRRGFDLIAARNNEESDSRSVTQSKQSPDMAAARNEFGLSSQASSQRSEAQRPRQVYVDNTASSLESGSRPEQKSNLQYQQVESSKISKAESRRAAPNVKISVRPPEQSQVSVEQDAYGSQYLQPVAQTNRFQQDKSRIGQSGMSNANRQAVGFSAFGSDASSNVQPIGQDDFDALEDASSMGKSRGWQAQSFNGGKESTFSQF